LSVPLFCPRVQPPNFMEAAATQTERVAAERPTESPAPALFWVTAIAVTSALLILRRPDAVFHAQLWAEDGVVWFADAYNHGALRALFFARDGYLQLFPRLVAAVSLWVPLVHVPLVFNLIALTVEAVPPLFLVSSRMRNLGPLPLRCALALVYLFVPDSLEVHAIVTDSQSQLAVLACLLIIADAPLSRWGKIFDVVVLVLCALTTPMGMLLLAVALARTVLPLLVHRSANPRPAGPEMRWRWAQVSLLTVCALLQGLTLLTTAGARLDTVLGASVSRFVRIVAGQILVPIFVGHNRLDLMARDPATVTALAVLITAVATLVCIYALLRGTPELRCFIFFAVLVLAAALTFPSVEPIEYQWDLFMVPGLGMRYWYIPKLAAMVTLLWLLGRQRPVTIRALAGALVCVMVLSAVRYCRYPPFPDFYFESYVRTFEQLPPGATGQFPLNPGGIWVMKLVKK
jgi:hypothetical protein